VQQQGRTLTSTDSMAKTPTVPGLLDQLEKFYGKQEPCWPVDPYEFLVWWQCGYPASDAACSKGWEKLTSEVGIEPQRLLKATPQKLSSALRTGGMVPELRGLRLKEIAMRVQDEFGDDLRGALVGPLAKARKLLRTFPGIADPGADRILLFAEIVPIAAVPSNCPQVLVRLLRGEESGNYAYLLLKRHGQEICKRTKPLCEKCPVSSNCVFFSGQRPGKGKHLDS